MVGLGGGVSVLASDAFETYGFSFPDLSEQIKAGLLRLSSAPGSIFKNPVDTARSRSGTPMPWKTFFECSTTGMSLIYCWFITGTTFREGDMRICPLQSAR